MERRIALSCGYLRKYYLRGPSNLSPAAQIDEATRAVGPVFDDDFFAGIPVTLQSAALADVGAHHRIAAEPVNIFNQSAGLVAPVRPNRGISIVGARLRVS